MIDKVLAILALLTFAGALCIIAWRVPHADLMVVIAIGIAMAGYDFYSHFRQQARAKAEQADTKQP